MDMYDSLFSPSCTLNEQISRQVFDVMPDGGLLLVIIDREGHLWPSDSEAFSRLHVSQSLLAELCAKIDDGAEPAITEVGDWTVVGAQLTTDRTNCGYVAVALDKRAAGSSAANMDLIEMVLSLIGVVGKLIEKNSLLYELQMKQAGAHGQSNVPLN